MNVVVGVDFVVTGFYEVEDGLAVGNIDSSPSEFLIEGRIV